MRFLAVLFVIAVVTSGVGVVIRPDAVSETLKSNARLLGSVQASLFSMVGIQKSCEVRGSTLASGTSKVFYRVPSVASGDTCASVEQVRSCTNGVLSGSSSYTYSSCYVDTSLKQIRENLEDFLPYVWSTTWYPWFNDTVGTDTAGRGFTLFKKHIDDIKAQGFNTVWIGGIFTWKSLQPTPGTWNAPALQAVKDHLKVLQDNNMRAIIQLNYIGPGYTPTGIDGCNWMKDPAQVAKFTEFVTALGSELAPYNYMTYYMVFTEQPTSCLIARNQFDLYEGFRLQPNGTSVAIDPSVQRTSHQEDVKEVNDMLKASIGSLPTAMPSAVRNQMYIGIHDALVSEGYTGTDGPAQKPFAFDYFSFAYYPTHGTLAAYPSDAAVGNDLAGAKTQITTILNRAKDRVEKAYPSAAILMGEFGWASWDTASNAPAFKLDSAARNVAVGAMLDWSIAQKIGFNFWAWVPRYIDTPSKDTPYENAQSIVARDANLETATPTLSTVSSMFRQKLLGEAPPPSSCSWNNASLAHGASVTAYQASSVVSGQTCVAQTRTCSDGTLSGTYTSPACTVSTAPTILTASCSTNGTKGTFSWPSAVGATSYYLNVYDSTTQKYVKGPNAVATSPLTVTTIPGNTYTSWIYVVTPAGWSAAVGAAPVTCPVPVNASCKLEGKTIAHGESTTAYQTKTVAYGKTCGAETRTCTNGTLSGTYAYSSCKVDPLTTVSSSCSSDGTKATFSWTAVPGATAYYFNVNDTTANQYVKGPNAAATSPVTITSVPGHTYTSWVYAVTASGWSPAVGAEPVVCAKP